MDYLRSYKLTKNRAPKKSLKRQVFEHPKKRYLKKRLK